MTSYTTPFDVWKRTGRSQRRENTVDILETGQTVQLEQHVITDTVKVLDGDGNIVDPENYDVDEDFNQLTYTGAETLSNVNIHYFTAPVPNSRAVRGVEQAESHIEEHLDTTFGGLTRVIDEVYETDGGRGTELMLHEQPVRDVEKVEINTNLAEDTEPNWETLEEGSEWYRTNTGLKLTSSINSAVDFAGHTWHFNDHKKLSSSQQQIRVTYTFGFEDVPPDIQNLAEILLIKDEGLNTVFGGMIDGRDNFDPATTQNFDRTIDRIMGEWSREFYHNFSTVVQQGTKEPVQ